MYPPPPDFYADEPTLRPEDFSRPRMMGQHEGVQRRRAHRESGVSPFRSGQTARPGFASATNRPWTLRDESGTTRENGVEDAPTAPLGAGTTRSDDERDHARDNARDSDAHEATDTALVGALSLLAGIVPDADDEQAGEAPPTRRRNTTRVSARATPSATRPMLFGRRGTRRMRAPRRSIGLAIVLGITFLVTCALPFIPLLSLGVVVADAAHRAVTLDSMLSGGAQSLLSPTALAEAQDNVNAIQRDLAVLSTASNVVGGPIAAVSGTARDYRLLIQVGAEVSTAGAEGLDVAQTVLLPLEGSALGSSGSSSGITQDDLNRVNAELSDAQAQIQLAITTSHQIEFSRLPSQLGPQSSLGHLLARLPEIESALAQLRPVLAAAPQLLGVSAPAYYLILAMDPSELRPAGGLMGNYGLLVLDHGQQSKQYPLSLHDIYPLDNGYYTNPTLNTSPSAKDAPACLSSGPQVPETYWWWPIRDFSCDYGWGVRDSGLSPDFPTTAQMAANIAEQSGVLPKGTHIQGVIAFTPSVIENILQNTGPLQVPEFNVTVTASTLQVLIHQYQLTDKAPQQGGRKTFTHDLSVALLQRIRGLHGATLKPVLKAVQQALAQKEIEIAFMDPEVENVLGKLNLTAGLDFGTGDGFYVVDTNDGGNKANTFVTEQQTDLVMPLPDGGALHLLRIAVTYDKRGSVYQGSTNFEDYSDVQRTYLPGWSEILGYAGFNPPIFYPAPCGHGGYTSPISACNPPYALTGESTPSILSDTPGANMVLGTLLVPCGKSGNLGTYQSNIDYKQCDTQPTKHTQTIYIAWYTPGVVDIQQGTHGTYTERVYKQPGSRDTFAVYLSTAELGGKMLDLQALADTVTAPGLSSNARTAAYDALLAHARQITSQPLTQDITITAHF